MNDEFKNWGDFSTAMQKDAIERHNARFEEFERRLYKLLGKYCCDDGTFISQHSFMVVCRKMRALTIEMCLAYYKHVFVKQKDFELASDDFIDELIRECEEIKTQIIGKFKNE